jgi:hypothetical protein
MAVKIKGKEIYHGADILKRYLHGGTWKSKIFKKGKGSQTPGNKKRSDTCQLSSIGGLPRKVYSKARSYKLRQYAEYCDFMTRVNKG